MVWFKVDDGFHSSRKVLSIPRSVRLQAVGLWTLAGTWSMKELTDGHVPDYVIDEMGGTPRIVDALVKSGLWSEVPEGRQFHDWTEYQPTRASVLDAREKEADRKRQAREKGRPGSVRADNKRTPAGQNAESEDPVPSRPVPTPSYGGDISIRPELNREGSGMDDEESLEEVNARLAERVYGVDWTKVRNKVGVLIGGIPNPSFVIALIAEVHDRAHKPIKSPTGVVLKSLDNDWADWQKRYYEQEGAA